MKYTNDLNKITIVGSVDSYTSTYENRVMVASAKIKTKEISKDKRGKEFISTNTYSINTYNEQAVKNLITHIGKDVKVEAAMLDNYRQKGVLLAFKAEPMKEEGKDKELAHVSGRLTEDFKVLKHRNGKRFASLEIVNNHYWKDERTSEWQNNTEYLPIKVFDEKTIEDLQTLSNSSILTKGCYIEAKGQPGRDWSLIKTGFEDNYSIDVFSRNSLLLNPSHELIQLCKENKYFMDYIRPSDKGLEPKIAR